MPFPPAGDIAIVVAGALVAGFVNGLTGTGYDGHTFWDTEGFVLPVLTYTDRKSVV